MTPGTRVRIHYPGRPYHGALGTVRSQQVVGTMQAHQVQLDAPVVLEGARRPHDVVMLIAKRLRAIKGQPAEPEPLPDLGNEVRWRGGMPEPMAPRWEGE